MVIPDEGGNREEEGDKKECVEKGGFCSSYQHQRLTYWTRFKRPRVKVDNKRKKRPLQVHAASEVLKEQKKEE